jgi:hypothetical protein
MGRFLINGYGRPVVPDGHGPDRPVGDHQALSRHRTPRRQDRQNLPRRRPPRPRPGLAQMTTGPSSPEVQKVRQGRQQPIAHSSRPSRLSEATPLEGAQRLASPEPKAIPPEAERPAPPSPPGTILDRKRVESGPSFAVRRSSVFGSRSSESSTFRSSVRNAGNAGVATAACTHELRPALSPSSSRTEQQVVPKC